MKVARVIGKVVLNQSVYEGRGGRWLVASPLDKSGLENLDKMVISKEPSCVVYDDLGADAGDLIAIADGGEATRPFDHPMPVDAYNAAIINQLNYKPVQQ